MIPLRRIKPAIWIALILAIGLAAWILGGDLDQAKRYYTGALWAPLTVEAHAVSASESEEAKPLEIDERPTVRVRRVIASDHQREVVVLGQTNIIKDAEVTAETAGRIVKLDATKGQWLDKGEIILRLAMDDRMAQLKNAEALVRYERIGFEAAQKLAKKKFQSEVRLAQEAADLERAKAELEAIKLDIARTDIRAPIDGYLETLPVGVGDYVDRGDKILDIVNPNPIRVVAQVSERDINDIKRYDTARVVTPEGEVFEGKVEFIARRAQELTRTYRVDVWIDNPEHKLREGLTMELRLKADADVAHKFTPAVLTLDDKGRIGVKAVGGDDRVRFYPIQILGDEQDGVWLGGLPREFDLITVGQEFVDEGQLVRPVPEDSLARPTS